jgi:hypothetical protein
MHGYFVICSAEGLTSGIDAGLLVAVDTGAVLIGTVSPAR